MFDQQVFNIILFEALNALLLGIYRLLLYLNNFTGLTCDCFSADNLTKQKMQPILRFKFEIPYSSETLNSKIC